ncbi:MAG: hypothetical protein ACREHD_15230 [Pirellulales bacterium]
MMTAAKGSAMAEVKVWDGRVYDVETLAMRYPVLASYAMQTSAFEELTSAGTFPSPSMRSLRVSLAALVWAFCLIVLFVIFLGALGFGPFYLLIDPAAVALVLVSIAVQRWSIREQERVSISDGEIRISKRGGCVRLPLSECFWYVGAFCHDGTQAFRGSKQAVCITHPDFLVRDGRGCVALGSSERAFEVLWQFLDLAAIPRLRDRRPDEYWIIAAVSAVSLLALHTSAFVIVRLAGYADGEFYLAVLLLPPVTALAAMYASALCGNDRWALTDVRGWITATSIGWFVAFGARFHLGGPYVAVALTSVLACAAMSWEITRPRSLATAGAAEKRRSAPTGGQI